MYVGKRSVTTSAAEAVLAMLATERTRDAENRILLTNVV